MVMMMNAGVLLFATNLLFCYGASSNDRGCGDHIMAANGEKGSLHSPGYPSQYQHNADCTYTIGTTSGSSHVKISFEVFSIEEHSECSFDYLEIYDGPTTESRKVGRYCGNNKPPAFSSTGRSVTVVFVSDTSVNEPGFVMDYSVGCTSHFTDASGLVKSPGYPSNYPDNTNCQYTIEPLAGSQFLLSILQFSVEDSNDCEYDYLRITNGKKGDVHKQLCGDRDPYKMLVNGTQLNLQFISDTSVSRAGFQLKYDVTESCATNNGGCQKYCHDISNGKVRCSCPPGFRLDDTAVACRDIDECHNGENPCSEACINTAGSFQCNCTTAGYILAPDGVTCTDMTCLQSNGGCEHICQSVGPASYHCSCHMGFKLAPDLHNCTDIDECTSTDPDYLNKCDQECLNQPGGYYCQCGDGWTLSKNRRSCDDVNECLAHEDECSHSCVDTPGSWRCACDEGFKIDPAYDGECIDIDECSEGLAPAVCTTCTNYEGAFECECPDGYNGKENATDCVDINECSDQNGGCQQLCLNKPGSYKCACDQGYKQTFNGSSKCVDINECATGNGNGPCDHYCENFEGSFECACLPGYHLMGDKLSCEDNNECAVNGTCGQDCVNTPGSYYCKCFDGYESTGKDDPCTDIDECSSKPCNSHPSSTCLNSIGSFHCTCPEGYRVVNTTECVDIDECANNDHDCEQICDNTPGGFTCNCQQGYALVDGSCVDINECGTTNPCEQDCFNSVGSFACDCRDGFYLLDNGRNCSDVNECKEETDNCAQLCVNHIGRHSCACRDGYKLDANNYTCSDVNECVMNISGCSDSDHCLNTQGSFFCFCDSGYELATDNKTCADRDECATNNGGCDHICANLPGSFKCGCDPGYVFHGSTSCVDLDECAVANGNCSQACNNHDGGYNCSCSDNYKLLEDDHTCSLCPTCETFTQLQTDVEKLKDVQETLRVVITTLARMGSGLSALEQRLEGLERLANDNN